VALLSFEGAENATCWTRKSTDMQIKVICYTQSKIAQQKKSQTKGISCRR